MRPMPRRSDTVAGAAQFACVLEASAEKPGNITPSHDFEDTSFDPLAVGTTTLSVGVPAGFSMPSNLQSIVATVN